MKKERKYDYKKTIYYIDFIKYTGDYSLSTKVPGRWYYKENKEQREGTKNGL